MLINLILRKCGISFWTKERHKICNEEAWGVKSRRIERSLKMTHKRRGMFLIGRKWAISRAKVLTVWDIAYRHGH